MVKGQIAGMKAKVLAEGTDIEPEQLLKEAEDIIDIEMAIQQVQKSRTVLNKTGDWLTSHPLEVCISQIYLCQSITGFKKKEQKNKRKDSL